MSRHSVSRIVFLFLLGPLALMLATMLLRVAPAAQAADRTPQGTGRALSSAQLWPAVGTRCSYAPVPDYTNPQATYTVLSRSASRVKVRVLWGSARAAEILTSDKAGRMRVRVKSIAVGGVTVRMSGTIRYPSVRGVKQQGKAVTSAVTLKASLPESQAEAVKPYLTHGRTVDVRVTFRAKGLGARTVEGYTGIGVSLTAGNLRHSNSVSAAHAKIRKTAKSYVALLTGVQWYGANYGLIAFGGHKTDGSGGLVLSGCS